MPSRARRLRARAHAPVSLTAALGLSAAVLLLDQLTKAWANANLPAGRPVEVLPFLDLTLGFNRGVVFGLFSSDSAAGPWLVIMFTGLISLGLIIWMVRERAPMTRTGLALVVGGAVSNLWDRSRDGAVTDFLDAHVGGLHWPSFNLADAAIVCAVGVLLWASLHRPGIGERS